MVELLTSLYSFLPPPFGTLTMAFFSILIAFFLLSFVLWIVKIVRG